VTKMTYLAIQYKWIWMEPDCSTNNAM